MYITIVPFVVLVLCLMTGNGISALCRIQDEGCNEYVTCCGGLKCDNPDGGDGFCQPSKSIAPSHTASNKPAKPSKPSKPSKPTNHGSSSGSSKYLITKEQFGKALTDNGFPAPSDEQYENVNSRAAPNGKITTKREMAMFLANVIHESDGFRAVVEYKPIDAPDAGNPGLNYHGRGYIQLSWEGNYEEASHDLFGDDRLVKNPDLVATVNDIAWDTAFWYWAKKVHIQAGVAQGKFGVTIMAINPDECTKPERHESQTRFAYYKKILAIFVPGEKPDLSGCLK